MKKNQLKKRWYCNKTFPLIPIIKIQKANEYRLFYFHFKWLFFTLWSTETPSIEIGFTMSTHWGIGFIGLLPYLRWACTIPIPFNVGCRIDEKLSRTNGIQLTTGGTFNH